MFFKKIKYKKMINEAKALHGKGDLLGAIKKYEDAFKILCEAFDFITLAFLRIDNEEYIKAIDMLEGLLKDYPNLKDCGDIYFALGLANYGLERKDLALLNFEKAISLGISIEDCYYLCGTCYDELGDNLESENTKKAIDYYNKALDINSKNIFCLINIGAIYEHNDINDKALEYFLKVYEYDKCDLTNICYNLGVVYTKLGEKDKALKHYLEDANKEEPYKSTFYNLALLYQIEFKEYDEAKKWYLKSLEKDEEDYNTWYNLACLYSLMEDYKNAYDCLTIIKFKKREYLKSIETDKDLVKFRETDYYKEIMR